ncbi:MAG: hypothetical protein ACP6IP_03670 [Candidatus Njordarchaeia archaeon]
MSVEASSSLAFRESYTESPAKTSPGFATPHDLSLLISRKNTSNSLSFLTVVTDRLTSPVESLGFVRNATSFSNFLIVSFHVYY